MPALVDHTGRGVVGARPRVAVLQTGSGSMSKNPSGHGLLVGAGGRADPLAVTNWSHTGVEWSWGPMNSPNANYACAMLLTGLVPRGPAPTASSWSWTAATAALMAELLGIRGEQVWSNISWTGGSTVGATAAVQRPFRETGLVYVSAGMNRSGTPAPTAVHSAGLTAIVDVAGANVARLYVWRYYPGTTPVVTWTFPSAVNNGIVAAIYR